MDDKFKGLDNSASLFKNAVVDDSDGMVKYSVDVADEEYIPKKGNISGPKDIKITVDN